jgi:pimeloyl-ACP methyl ester carboxylesterase
MNFMASRNENVIDNSTQLTVSQHQYLWTWQGQPLKVVYETLGEGTPVLLLPAFSTVSSRSEMRPIAESLSAKFKTVSLDFPGFGQSERLAVDYIPELYQQFLQDFVQDIFDSPTAIIAAGHTAGYVIQLAQKLPKAVSKIVLVAPTWRGPLPTMGAKPQVSGMVRQIVRSPIIGQALYKLNTTPSFLRLMYKRHVYADEAQLTPEFIAQKWQITQQPGARYAPAAFVTGNLDPVQEQADFLALFQPLPVPLMVIIGEQVPPKSRMEMDVIAGLPGVQTAILPGSLGMHEEYGDAVAKVILPFLGTADH